MQRKQIKTQDKEQNKKAKQSTSQSLAESILPVLPTALPAHQTARPLRQAVLLNQQQHQGNTYVSRLVQRDLAVAPPSSESVDDQPDLTGEQVARSIRYNRASYDEESTRLIQDVVGAEVTGVFDEGTIRLIAQYQEEYGLDADGKVGPDTYDLLANELVAEGGDAPESCLTMFQIEGPMPLRFFRHSSTPTQATIGSHFKIHIRFDPRCHPEDWEYRQYIKGSVTLHDTSGVTQSADSAFSDLPAGSLTSSWEEDGDTAISAGVAGNRYGHRDYRPNPGDGRDRYLPERTTGNIYEGYDYPELGPIPASSGDAGDRYEWEMNFRGVIIRAGHGVVQEKYWSIRGTLTIPAMSVTQVDAT